MVVWLNGQRGPIQARNLVRTYRSLPPPSTIKAGTGYPFIFKLLKMFSLRVKNAFTIDNFLTIKLVHFEYVLCNICMTYWMVWKNIIIIHLVYTQCGSNRLFYCNNLFWGTHKLSRFIPFFFKLWVII